MAVRGIFSHLVSPRDRTWLRVLKKTTGSNRFYTEDGRRDGYHGDKSAEDKNVEPKADDSASPSSSLVEPPPLSETSPPASQYVSSRKQKRQEKIGEKFKKKAMLQSEKYFLDFVKDSKTTTNKEKTEQHGHSPSLEGSNKMDSALQEFLKTNPNAISHMPGGEPNVAEQPEFPSDNEEYRKWYQSQERFAVRPSIDPETTTILLFPGQGSQFVGMGKKLIDGHQRCREMYEIASSILGYDLLKLCLEGPQSELDRTVVCQPAVMVTSLAAVEWLQEENPKVIEKCISTAGFSVGEFSALVFAGVLDFEDAVKLIKVRAEGMQAASEETPSGMMSVFCTHRSKLGLAMQVAKEVCKQKYDLHGPVCQIANYLYPDCKVIAGHDMALSFIENNMKDFGIRRTKRLPVSGAFHTPIMEPSVPSFAEALKNLEIREPLFPVYSNVKAKMYLNSPKGMKKLLRKHLTSAVKWEQILHVLYSRDKSAAKFPHTYELGPGKQLGTLLRMVNLKAYGNYHSVDV
ncbi:malonyl-CoA-acyl carrier protein transacylase, mitochondrial [Octopus bimaculoides]|uniref:[acyl-carrier-protein] S-malonyltransferase n=1 Tax=Octopus bimaculoides TaxID=37653 RepID=A0A0L8I9Q8_OCTBM|nr:malonyl-CoA-acyl carrier protein transacylase, mitochondrial [Octopus bimaculoides]XP_014783913.1 malonyl-CoA-acyl carrier protein transacylase, mitochondrial [Octopus bimaculoides]|eukprot:XP_014783905.1 PREDICTED: malonyl-CoA-acyl carrier protein transacylase, mitochondrial-like [Octopus bimaculoides]